MFAAESTKERGFTCRNVLAPGALVRNSLATMEKRSRLTENTAASQNCPAIPACNSIIQMRNFQSERHGACAINYIQTEAHSTGRLVSS